MRKKTLKGYESPLAEILTPVLNKSIMVDSSIGGPENYDEGVNVDDIFE